MSSAYNSSFDDAPSLDDATQQFFSIQFWIFLLLVIPSIICILFALYHLLHDPNLRQGLHNHVIIVLLVVNLFFDLTDVPFVIHYFHTFQPLIATNSFRVFWGYIDWGLFPLQYLLYTWTTLERHILIFHDHLTSTRKKRIFFHYLPPIIIIIYCFVYYTILFYGSQCENDFSNVIGTVVIPCSFGSNTLYLYEMIAHAVLPTFSVIICSVVLLLRVVWQKYHAQRQIHWRQYRKMTIQLLIVSCLYLIFPFPYMFMMLLYLCGMPTDIGAVFVARVVYVCYYTFLLFPIFTVGSVPELTGKLKKLLPFRRQRQRLVHPVNINTARLVGNHVMIQ